jgi:hypothetical protein
MATLKSYPTVIRAFQALLMEMQPSKMDIDAEVPENWNERFAVAEPVLASVKDATLADVWNRLKSEHREAFHGVGATMDELCWTHVVEPVNESAEWVLAALGFTEQQILAVEEVLNNFFDGDLWCAFCEAAQSRGAATC